MRSGHLFEYLLIAAAVALCSPLPMRSQEPSDTPPKPAARSVPPLSNDNQVTDENGTDIRPDSRPLTGFQNPTTGAPQLRHSFWQTGISYDDAIQSNGQAQGGAI